MPNQSESPELTILSGSTDDPISKCFDHFVSFNNLSDRSPEELEQIKFVFYCSAMHTYNLMVEAMRRDHTMQLTAALSESMRVDLDAYFHDLQPTIN